MSRKTYSLQFKLDAIEYSHATSTSKAAEHFGVNISQIKRWKCQKDQFESKNIENRNNEKRMRKQKWPEMEKYLKGWIEARRREGQKVIGQEILKEAREQAVNLNIHDFKGSICWVHQFMKRNQVKPSLVPKIPDNWQEMMNNFIEFVNENKQNYTLDHIGSADEIVATFDMPSNPLINQFSSDIRNSVTEEKLRFTIILCVTANCKKLPPYVIFRAKTIPDGNYPLNIIISASEKSVVTPSEIMTWHEKVWMKRKNSIFHRKSMLIIDSDPSHRAEEVKAKFAKNSTLIAMIPDGITKKLQVIDISVKKYFMQRLRHKVDKWIVKCYKVNTKSGYMKYASFEDICQLIVEAWDEVPETTIKNSFKRTTIDFYGECQETIVKIENGSDIEEMDDDDDDKDSDEEYSQTPENYMDGYYVEEVGGKDYESEEMEEES